MNVLVTGGCGYIGSHTCLALQAAGMNPVVVDNLGNSKRSVLTRVAAISGQQPLFYQGDIRDAALLERMGLTRENLMACGDGLNDRSMISYAGVGVAMQNAEDAVKAVADYVTAADNNHDGVAEAIEKFILN